MWRLIVILTVGKDYIASVYDYSILDILRQEMIIALNTPGFVSLFVEYHRES